jgi:hypothetical protein
VIKSWFKIFEKVLSKSLKRNKRKGIGKKRKEKRKKQNKQTPIPARQPNPPNFFPRSPNNQPAHLTPPAR